MGFLSNLIRSLFFLFDQLIYGFIPDVYDFMMILTEIRVFDEETIGTLANNIYAVIGFFMLFVMSFKLLTAVINPEMLTDKEKGFGKTVSRSIIALVLIALMPFIFEYSWVLQRTVIKQMIIQKAIIGKQVIDKVDEAGGYGLIMSSMTLNAFLNCDTGNCTPDQMNHIENLIASESYGTIGADYLNAPGKNSDDYGLNYTFFFSTVVGAVILIMLVLFSVDIAVRSVKLGFLQVISPAAIVSFVEPKSSQSGFFKKWMDLTISVYILLFTRILAITFVAFTLSKIPHISYGDATGSTLAFMKIFLIIGALIFAKEAPKIIADLFGMKEGFGTLNPLKRMAGGNLIKGVARGATGIGAALGMKGLATGVGGVRGMLAARREGGSMRTGFREGAKAGRQNVSLKEGYKGGFKGIGKSLWAGTGGAYKKSGDEVAKQITGEEQATSFWDRHKEKKAYKQGVRHESLQEKKAKEFYDQMNSKSGENGATADGVKTAAKKDAFADEHRKAYQNQYKNKQYGSAVFDLDKAKYNKKKKELELESLQRQYTQDPSENKRRAYEDAYTAANDAAKAVDHYQSEIDKLDKNPANYHDTVQRKTYESYSAKADAKEAIKDKPKEESNSGGQSSTIKDSSTGRSYVDLGQYKKK